MGTQRLRLQPWITASLVLLLGTAHAGVVGETPSLFKRLQVRGDVVAIGASSLRRVGGRDQLKPRSTAQLAKGAIPKGARIASATLVWSGTSRLGPDRQVTFILPDRSQHTLGQSADCRMLQSRGALPAYRCRADVGRLFADRPVSPGAYALQGLDTTLSPPRAELATHAAWSLILVYEGGPKLPMRDVLLYDAFLHLDETANSAGVTRFKLAGFQAGKRPVVAISNQRLAEYTRRTTRTVTRCLKKLVERLRRHACRDGHRNLARARRVGIEHGPRKGSGRHRRILRSL